MDVVTIEARTKLELLCQHLLHTSGAETVMLLDKRHVLAHASVLTNPFVEPSAPGSIVEEARQSRVRRIGPLRLAVHFRAGVDKKLLDERMEKTAGVLKRLLRDWTPPASGGDGPSGLSAVAWESVEIFKKKN
jgi:hypothetical protein